MSVATVNSLGLPLSRSLFLNALPVPMLRQVCVRVFFGVFFLGRFLEGFGWSRGVLSVVVGCQKEQKVSNKLLKRRVFAELVETRFDL